MIANGLPTLACVVSAKEREPRELKSIATAGRLF